MLWVQTTEWLYHDLVNKRGESAQAATSVWCVTDGTAGMRYQALALLRS